MIDSFFKFGAPTLPRVAVAVEVDVGIDMPSTSSTIGQ